MNNKELLSEIITQSTFTDADHKKYMEMINGIGDNNPVSIIIERTLNKCVEGELDPWNVDLVIFGRIIYDLVFEGKIGLPEAGILISAAWSILSMQVSGVMEKFAEKRAEYSDGDQYEMEEDMETGIDINPAVNEFHYEQMPQAPILHSEKRKVMLVELMEILGGMDFSSVSRAPVKPARENITIGNISEELNTEEPEEEIKRVLESMKSFGRSEFYIEEAWGNDRNERIMFFVYSLFLCRRGIIRMEQETPWSGIMIRISDAN